jgi:hypothetical protein
MVTATLSVRYSDLAIRLNELKKRFLPLVPSSSGVYRDRQIDKARAYRVLSHSEIEGFLEDRAEEVVTKAVSQWKTNGTVSVTLLCLGTFLAPHTLDKNCDLRNRIEFALSQYLKRLKANNGVREHNVTDILFPLGIQARDIDPLWLVAIDDFGKSRGDTAHNPKKTQNSINPVDEEKTVQTILAGLHDIDLKLSTLA